MHKKWITKFGILIIIFTLVGCTQGPLSWWSSINKKAKHLASLEANYEALKTEHEKLKAEYFRLENQYDALKAETQSKETAEMSLALAGSKEGRSPASIHYEVPKGLKPQEILDLAYDNFKEKKFAEAAVTFEEFFALPESASMKATKAFYTAGVAWFQVQNYNKAKENFEAAETHAEGEEREKTHKKVDLWMRAIDRKIASSNNIETHSISNKEEKNTHKTVIKHNEEHESAHHEGAHKE